MEQKLKNSKAVRSILDYLGYTDTGSGDVSLREPVDRHQIINVALDLFLAQVDLEVMKKIIDNGDEGEFKLEWVVEVRQKTCGVKDAVDRLRQMSEKPKKLDQAASNEETNVTKDTSETQHRGRHSSRVRSTEVGNGNREPKYPPVASVNSNVKPDDRSVYSGLVKRFGSSSFAAAAYEERNQHQASLAGLQDIEARHVLVAAPSTRIAASLNQFQDADMYGETSQGSQDADAVYHTPEEVWKNDQFVDPSVKCRTAAERHITSYSRLPYAKDGHRSYYGTASNANLTDDGLAGKTTDQTTRNIAVQLVIQGGDSAARLARHDHILNSQSGQVSFKSDFVAARRNSPADSVVSQKEIRFQERNDIGNPGKMPTKSGTPTSSEYEKYKEVNGRSEAPLTVPQMTPKKHMVTKCKEEMLGDEKSKLALPESYDMSKRGTPKHSTKPDVNNLNTNLHSQLNLYTRNCDRSSERRRTEDEKSVKDKHQTAPAAVGNTDFHLRPTSLSSGSSRERSADPSDCRRHTIKRNTSSTDDHHFSSDVRNTSPGMSQKPFSFDLQDTAHMAITPSESCRRDTAAKFRNSGRSSRTTNTTELGKSVQDPSVPGPFQSRTLAQCQLCQQEASNICGICKSLSCSNCISNFKADLCGQAKTSHRFTELKEKRGNSGKSVATYSPLDPRSVGDEVAKAELPEDWSCKRCTFLNPPDNKICAMCAKSRDGKDPDFPEPGSRVCKHCTFYNSEETKVCEACSKTLDLMDSETLV